MKDREFYYNCQEILLEYDLLDGVKTKPEYRLAYSLLVNAMLVHKINCAKEQQQLNINNLNKPVNNDLKEKFNNL